MAEGNGVDIGSMYGLLVEIGKAVSRHEAALERQGQMLERLIGVVEQHGVRLQSLERGLAANTAELADLRQTVAAYHSSVVGHGITVSELDARTHRVDDHLGLPPFVHG